MQIAKHIVPLETPKARLSDYLVGIFPQLPSRKSCKTAIKKGSILLNNKQGYTGDWVAPKDEIVLLDIDQRPQKIFAIKIEVLFEDEDIAVVMKPAGIAVSGHQFQTVENALLNNIQPSTKIDAFKQPRAVHRLDAPTTGLLLIAKTKTARIHLGEQFENRTIQKRYQAIVIGKTPQKGEINLEIDGKVALSSYEQIRVVKSLKNKHLSLLNLYPKTGRTHQLRIHLSSLGFPILGDPLYGIEGLVLKHKGLFLVAAGLEFVHPSSQERMQLSIETPYKYTALLDREQRRFDRYHDANKEA